MRTTADKVKKIIETELDDSTIESYIEGASTLVTSILGQAGLGSALLAEIERWMTAHFIAATRERQTVKEEAGGAKVQYTGEFAKGLNSTSYGQNAIAMDISGELAMLGDRAVTIRAIRT